MRAALTDTANKCLIITYTLNNEAEIRFKFIQECGLVPEHVTIKTWFSFLLDDFVRPYQNVLYDKKRVAGLAFVDGRSARYVAEGNTEPHYLSKKANIYSDKIAKFGCKCDERTGGQVIDRICRIYKNIYIDEVQDLAAWDIDFLELLLAADISVNLVGDPRQATYRTNNAAKNKKYVGTKIVDKFAEWAESGICELEFLNISFRCNQSICNFADQIFPNIPNTFSKNSTRTGHDGVFVVRKDHVQDYIEQYSPKILRYNRREKCLGYPAQNFKDSKGLTFERVLIFPHGPVQKLLENADFSVLTEPTALYVAITRAKHSVAFVFDGENNIDGVEPVS